jgi:2,4-dienoyl-CoA reductase-like NADH-dependent reductase (Old Yellow Enzyme family)
MTEAEIEMVIEAWGQAGRRAVEAGFDAVQIHAAHGYINSQFLSPLINKRTDQWGGSLEKRTRFLQTVVKSVREAVGPAYPVFIKLGMMDGEEGGLTLEESAQVTAELAGLGINAVETSAGLGGKKLQSIQKGIRKPSEEAYFRHFAQAVRAKMDLPVLLVGGMRSREVMEEVLESGDADFISISRPLINDPQLPEKMRRGEVEISGCLSANNCWAEKDGEGIACKCPI